jgi:5-methylcytosine-specific restriction endonuclease McrA
MEIQRNMNQLRRYLHSTNVKEKMFARDLIERGTCFVITESKGNSFFGPSRFVGYRSNTMTAHNKREKDGRITNLALEALFDAKPEQDNTAEKKYRQFCQSFGFEARRSGNFGVPRKFWMLSAAKEKHLELSFYSLEKKFERSVKSALQDTAVARQKRLKHAVKIPKRIQVTIDVFVRNPDVVAEVLNRASGYCEYCKMPAPFHRRTDKTPYLEVHHKIQLANGGRDVVENAVALCPNCHREAHYGEITVAAELRHDLGRVRT